MYKVQCEWVWNGGEMKVMKFLGAWTWNEGINWGLRNLRSLPQMYQKCYGFGNIQSWGLEDEDEVEEKEKGKSWENVELS